MKFTCQYKTFLVVVCFVLIVCCFLLFVYDASHEHVYRSSTDDVSVLLYTFPFVHSRSSADDVTVLLYTFPFVHSRSTSADDVTVLLYTCVLGFTVLMDACNIKNE